MTVLYSNCDVNTIFIYNSYFSFLTVKTDIIVFQSSLTKTIENIKQNEILIFDKVSLSEENAYNVTSGIFTAPVDGIYSFSWTILTKGGKYFITDIMLNGRPIAFNYTDGRRTGRILYVIFTF